MPNKLLEVSKELISSSLAGIFNQCIQINIFPHDFKVVRVTPIFKSGDKEDLNNYRPISVLPTVVRIFEKLLYEQLYKYFMDNEILGKTQWRLRSLLSTALASNNCTSDWLLNIDRGNVNTVVFLDIKRLLIPLITLYCQINLKSMEYVVKSFCSLNRTSQTENRIAVFKIGTHLSNPYLLVFSRDLS